MATGIGSIWFIIGILLILAPLGIWNRLIKIHTESKKANELLERIAKALEGRIGKPQQPSAHTPGKYSRS